MKPLVAAAVLMLSLVMYVPQFQRILARRTTGDYSKAFLWMVLAIQFLNGTLATLESAWYLFGLYCLHFVLVLATIVLVYRYYDG